MTTDPENNPVRRVGKNDQKKELPASDLSFPQEDDEEVIEEEFEIEFEIVEETEGAEETEEHVPPPDLDLDALSLPDSDHIALQTLSTLPEGSVRAPVITPETERYPPLAPRENPNTGANEQGVVDGKMLHRRRLRYNLITILGLLGTLLTITWIVTIWNDPISKWNPLPPSTPFFIVTATPGSGIITPTPNESGQIIIVATQTIPPTAPPTDSPYPFILSGPVLYAPNSNDLGCNWWSIAGTVTDVEGRPLNGYRIRVQGEDLVETVFSGAVLAFGPGGFEVPLIGTPQEAEFTVQLFSPQDAPLSGPIPISTQADCDGNVTILNFRQNR